MLIKHKQSFRMLSVICRCILNALVSVVVFMGCIFETGQYEAGREKHSLLITKTRLHHCLQP